MSLPTVPTLYVIFAIFLYQALAQLPGGIDSFINGQDGNVMPEGNSDWMLITKMIEMEQRMNLFEIQMEQMKLQIDELENRVTPGGGMGTWGPFSNCSISCTKYGNQTSGIQTRSRTCNSTVPSNGGCQGSRTETRSCTPAVLCPMSVAPLNPSDAIGGNGGWPFSDSDLWMNKPVTGIRMQCGRVLVSMQLKYGDSWGPVWGGEPSRWCEFPATYDVEADFAPDEYVVGIDATHNTYINSVTLKTNKRDLQKCGSTTGNTIKSIRGNRMLFISGRKGCYVDRLNLHWAA